MKSFFKIVLTLMVIGFFTPDNVHGQRWNRYRKEFGFHIGASGMLGDLGGGKGQGSRYGDLQPENTSVASYTLGVTWKYRIHNNMALRANLFAAQLYSDDKTTENLDRRLRNLDAKTGIIELSGQYEFYLIRERIGNRYKVKNVKGYGSNHFAWYLFAGVGGIYYNPFGTTQSGDWVRLAPLNTEGQGLEGGPKDYSQFTLIIPFGTGVKYNISHLIGIQFEVSMRLTNTDYLDDVSTTYYDGEKLAENFGELSKEMADKRYWNPNRHSEGGIRGGNEQKDVYMYATFGLTYRWRSRAKSRVRL